MRAKSSIMSKLSPTMNYADLEIQVCLLEALLDIRDLLAVGQGIAMTDSMKKLLESVEDGGTS